MTPPSPPRTTEQPGAVSPDCSDAELSAAVAQYVANLKPVYREDWGNPWCYQDGVHEWPVGGTTPIWKPIPDYATSADAVLPLLEKAFAVWSYHSDRPPGHFCADIRPRDQQFFEAYGPFARAACFALLRAANVTVTGSAQEAGK